MKEHVALSVNWSLVNDSSRKYKKAFSSFSFQCTQSSFPCLSLPAPVISSNPQPYLLTLQRQTCETADICSSSWQPWSFWSPTFFNVSFLAASRSLHPTRSVYIHQYCILGYNECSEWMPSSLQTFWAQSMFLDLFFSLDRRLLAVVCHKRIGLRQIKLKIEMGSSNVKAFEANLTLLCFPTVQSATLKPLKALIYILKLPFCPRDFGELVNGDSALNHE